MAAMQADEHGPEAAVEGSTPVSRGEAHGGEVDLFAEAYGVAREHWIDLSTGINPVPFPLPDLARDYWYRLPDAGIDTWLREAAARCYGVADPAHIIATPGSQAAIQWLPRLLPATAVAILGPTYPEHRSRWAEAGHTVLEIAALDQIPQEAGVVIVVNPNNPTGRQIEPEPLLAAGRDRLLVVDEAFADLVPDISLARFAGRPDLVILRSVGKFFGLAGMRLGFALAGEPLAGRLRQAFGPWAVSGPAAAIGAVALADEAWARAARVRLTAAAGRLDGLLVRHGLAIAGGTVLFRLAAYDRAFDLFDHLARAAILVRRFADHPNWLRFGLPADDGAFARLGQALASWRPKAVKPAALSDRSRYRPSAPSQPLAPAKRDPVPS